MKKFKVVIREVRYLVAEVESNNEDEAEAKVRLDTTKLTEIEDTGEWEYISTVEIKEET